MWLTPSTKPWFQPCGMVTRVPFGVCICKRNPFRVHALLISHSFVSFGTFTVRFAVSDPVNNNCQNRAWLGPAGGGVPERSTVPLVAADEKTLAIASSKIWKSEMLALLPHVLLSFPVPDFRRRDRQCLRSEEHTS